MLDDMGTCASGETPERIETIKLTLISLGILFGLLFMATAEVLRKKFIEVGWDMPDTAFRFKAEHQVSDADVCWFDNVGLYRMDR